MAAETSFDYYYGDESNQFSFYRIPRQLITGERFKRLSTDAKLLYGLLLDRMGLSAKNGWYDEQGRVFIYYTLDEIQEDLNCAHGKAVKLLSELDTGNGFGLIERVKQGQGRPTKIFVKQFTTREKPPQPAVPQDIPRLPIIRADAALDERLDMFKKIRGVLEEANGRVVTSAECDLNGEYRPVNVKENAVTADFSRPLCIPMGKKVIRDGPEPPYRPYAKAPKKAQPHKRRHTTPTR